MAGLVRHWATLNDGLLTEEATLRRDVDKIVKAITAKPGTKTAKAN